MNVIFTESFGLKHTQKKDLVLGFNKVLLKYIYCPFWD